MNSVNLICRNPMGKFGKAVRAFWWILRKPVLLNRVLTDEDTWKSYVDRKYGMPLGLNLVRMDQLVKSESVLVGPVSFLDGGSLPTDLMLLAGLAGEMDDCRYFEIGTWRGESVALVARHASHCHTLCLTNEEMRSMGMHEITIASHRLFSDGLDNVTQLRGNSKTFDFKALDQKFDLVFIDGDHHYDAVVNDTRNVFDYLVHEKSVVVWHDYGEHPDRVRFEVMAAILDGAGKERRGKIFHVAHTKCAIYTGKDVPSSGPGFPRIPDEYYELKVSRKKR